MNIGLVGVGPWGAHILRDLRTLGAVVHAVARSPKSIERAQKGGAASVVFSPDALPHSCSGYVVANRTTSHLDAVEELLPRGRPIYVEKPLTSDVARAKRLPEEAHHLVFIMHKWRYHPGVIELARIAAREDYGPAEGLRSFRLGWGVFHADVSTLWTLAPHEYSIALEIFGEVPRPVAAWQDPLTSNEAAASARLETRAGVPIMFEVSTNHPVKLRRLLLKCRDAVCQLDDTDYGAISVRPLGARSPDVIRVGDELPLFAELRAFLDHLRGGPPPKTSFAEELQVIESIAEIEAMIASR